MPIAPDTLQALARAYAREMTPIRGRRVQRLVARAFAAFDQVLAARAADGAAVLLALADDGRAALLRTDGRGPAAEVVVAGRGGGASVATAHDLLKDSLPVLGWRVRHPAFAAVAGELVIDAAGRSAVEVKAIEQALARL